MRHEIAINFMSACRDVIATIHIHANFGFRCGCKRNNLAKPQSTPSGRTTAAPNDNTSCVVDSMLPPAGKDRADTWHIGHNLSGSAGTTTALGSLGEQFSAEDVSEQLARIQVSVIVANAIAIIHFIPCLQAACICGVIVTAPCLEAHSAIRWKNRTGERRVRVEDGASQISRSAPPRMQSNTPDR